MIVEVGTGPSGSCASSTWSMVFNWGDGISSNNGSLGSTHPENDNENIPFADLYGTPLQTGIAIDLNAVGITSGTYPCLRLSAPLGGANDPAQTDSIEVLP